MQHHAAMIHLKFKWYASILTQHKVVGGGIARGEGIFLEINKWQYKAGIHFEVVNITWDAFKYHLLDFE